MGNCFENVLEYAKLAYTNKTRESIIPLLDLGYCNLPQISKGNSVVIFSTSFDAKCLLKF